MCRINGVEAVFGRFASYEATGTVIEEYYSGGEWKTQAWMPPEAKFV